MNRQASPSEYDSKPLGGPAATGSDPLADSILFLAAHHGRALSREALLAGLPITDARLTVALYQRAALRAGFEVEPVKRPLAEIAALVLPTVLIMRDGTTRIMLEAHLTGVALVTVCPLELAELYRERLESCGLTATIEAA